MCMQKLFLFNIIQSFSGHPVYVQCVFLWHNFTVDSMGEKILVMKL